MEFGVAVFGCAVIRAGIRRALRLLIEFGENALNVVGKFFGGFDDTVVIVGREFVFRLFDGSLDGRFILFGKFVAAVFQSLFDREDERVEFILILDDFFSLLIFFLVLLSLFDGFVDVRLGEVGRRSNRNISGFLSAEIFCGYMYDTVGVDIESNFDLRNTSRRGSDARKIELTEG